MHKLAALAYVKNWSDTPDAPDHQLHKKDVIYYGVHYSIATPLTSFIAVEDRNTTSTNKDAEVSTPSLDVLCAGENVDTVTNSTTWKTVKPISGEELLQRRKEEEQYIPIGSQPPETHPSVQDYWKGNFRDLDVTPYITKHTKTERSLKEKELFKFTNVRIILPEDRLHGPNYDCEAFYVTFDFSDPSSFGQIPSMLKRIKEEHDSPLALTPIVLVGLHSGRASTDSSSIPEDVISRLKEQLDVEFVDFQGFGSSRQAFGLISTAWKDYGELKHLRSREVAVMCAYSQAVINGDYLDALESFGDFILRAGMIGQVSSSKKERKHHSIGKKKAMRCCAGGGSSYRSCARRRRRNDDMECCCACPSYAMPMESMMARESMMQDSMFMAEPVDDDEEAEAKEEEEEAYDYAEEPDYEEAKDAAVVNTTMMDSKMLEQMENQMAMMDYEEDHYASGIRSEAAYGSSYACCERSYSKKSKKACLLSTAAAGTSLAPRLDSIRWFRDSIMPEWQVYLYYNFISPPIAQFLQNHPSARKFVRALTWPIVLFIDHPSEFLMLFLIPLLSVLFYFIFFFFNAGEEGGGDNSDHQGQDQSDCGQRSLL